jgi:diaminohydroxyphosphoribosylaminopyrimidine deaminase / 5-amino-6-(5-phosphoribosylamino)uracil reductase
MAVALDLARLAEGRTSPNPVVGAVLVRGGKIIGRGFHRGPGRAHAEIEAIQNACRGEASLRPARLGRPLHGTTLYVTLEPCCHYGRTPPCSDAILRSGIQEVVIGMKDPDRKVSGKGIKILKKAGIKVRVGVLEKECRELNEAYITHRTKKRPFVILKMASTVDGKVGLRGRRCKITGAEADRQVHALRDRVDAILVGGGTVLSDNPRLTTRLKGGRGRDPIRIILDGRRGIPSSARLFHLRSLSPTWRASELTKGKSAAGRVNLKALLRELGRRGIMSLLVEGGPHVWSSFLDNDLVDLFLLFIARKRLGARGVPALPSAPRNLRLNFANPRRIGRDILLEGRP